MAASRNPVALASFGELLLRLSTRKDESLLQAGKLDRHIGGAEANVAVSLSRLGHQTRMISRVPDNPLGDAAVSELRFHGVDVSGIETSSGRMGLYFMESGVGLRSSRITYDRQGSAIALADPADYQWNKLLNGVSWLHLSGVTPALGDRPARACAQAAEAAVKLGVQVSFDGNYREQLWALRRHRGKHVLRDLLAAASTAFINDRDLELILGREFEGEPGEPRIRLAADAAFSEFRRLERICCSLREGMDYGALMITRKRVLRSRTHKLIGASERVGAGDAFAAGVLHGLISRWSEARAIEFGAAAGALKHFIRGDFNLVDPRQILHLASGGGSEIKR